jgi:hypothetical protein
LKRSDVERLLGGYSAGILTDEERRMLFEAALEDQALFTELVRDEPLRELLSDPSVRAELRSALTPSAEVERGWLWWRFAAAGLLSAAFGIALLLVWRVQPEMRLEMAKLQAPAAPALAYEQPLPAPARSENLRRDAPPPRAGVAAGLVERRRTTAGDAAGVPGSAAGEAAKARPAAPEFAFRSRAPQAPLTLERRPASESMALEPPSAAPTTSARRRATSALVRFTSEARARERFYSAEESGIRYALMLRQPDGTFAEIPTGSVVAGAAEVRLAIEPNAAGLLRVLDERGTVIFERAAGARQRYFVDMPPDRRSLEISFASGAAEPEELTTEVVATPAENAVYVVNPGGSGVQVVVPIRRSPAPAEP